MKGETFSQRRANVVFTNSLTQRRRRRPPQLARQVLRNNRDLAYVIEIGPREVASRDEWGWGVSKSTAARWIAAGRSPIPLG